MDWTQVIITAIPVIGSVLTVIITAMIGQTAKKTQTDVAKTQVDVETVRNNTKATTAAVVDLMRNEITKLYYKRQDVEELYQYERESLDKMYKGYHEAGGNSFVDDIYKDMRTWKVVSAGRKIGEPPVQ